MKITFNLLFYLTFQLLIINYLFKLEKDGCRCAMDYKRTYILSYLVFTTFVLIFQFFFHSISLLNINKYIIMFILIIFNIAGIINIVFIIKYVHMLKDRKCTCSESVYRDTLYVFTIIDACLLGLTVSLILYTFLFSTKNISYKKYKVKK